jgi:hypothetical protein
MVILGGLVASRYAGANNVLAGVDEQAVERARRSASPYASLVIAGASIDASSSGTSVVAESCPKRPCNASGCRHIRAKS